MINFCTSANLVKVLVLTAFLLASIQTASAAEKWKTCDLSNYTDHTITELYMWVSGYDINEVGKNMLEGQPPVKNGETLKVNYNAEHRYYNVRVIFDNGDLTDWEKLDCKNLERITLFKDGEVYRAKVN